MVPVTTKVKHPTKRSCTTRFDEDALKKALRPFAQLKVVDWRWDALHYSKGKRGCGPDKEQLACSEPILKAILGAAPNGFPNLGSLRSVWIALDDEFNVLENKADGVAPGSLSCL